VLDLDLPHGPESWEALQKQHGPCPETLTARTGGGGLHLYFKWSEAAPVKNSASKLGPGIDSRGAGGSIILPPSGHKSGGVYRWQNKKPLAEAPQWLVDLLKKEPPRPANTRPQMTILDGSAYGQAALEQEAETLRQAPQGQRNAILNEAAFSLGGLVAGGELPLDLAEQTLFAAAQQAGLPELEITKTLESGLRAGMQAPRTAPEPIKPQGKPEAPTASKEPDQWPEVEPLCQALDSLPYPLASLPEKIKNAVAEVANFVQCPIEMAACSCLTALSTVGAGIADVQRTPGLTGPTSIFVLVAADSGERKSTVDNLFTEQISTWEARRTKEMEPDLKRYSAELLCWEAEKQGILSAIKKSAQSEIDKQEIPAHRQRLEALENAKPKRPPVPCLILGDESTEHLTARLFHQWPVGGLLSAEGGVILGAHGMSAENQMKNLSTLNALWSGESIRIGRISREGYILTGARLTLGIAVQPETLRRFDEGTKGLARGSGFYARCLIALPKTTQGKRFFKDAPANWPALEAFRRRMLELLEQPLTYDLTGNLRPKMLELSPEAKSLWVQFHNAVEKELLPGGDAETVRDFASKAAENAARIAALFHLFESGTDGQISASDLERAADLVSWHLLEARRFTGELALPLEVLNALKLEQWLVDYCKEQKASPVPRRLVMQFGPQPTRRKKNLDAALDELQQAGRIRHKKEGRIQIIEVNPDLLGK
jgi:hypothetical protein